MTPCRLAVVGGGLAGLVVAYRRMRAGDEVTLLESSGRLGGQLSTLVSDGFVVERGAEGFSASSDAVLALAAELGLKSQVVKQRHRRSYFFDGRVLSILEAGEAPARLGWRVSAGQSTPRMAAFRRGMGQLVAALARRIRGHVVIRLSDPVWFLSPSGSRWELGTGSLSRVRADRVVLATSSRVAGALLSGASDSSTALEGGKTLSSVTVSLAYPRWALRHPLDGAGFVVGESVWLEGCRACTFSSSKLPGRAPEGYALLRLFFRPSTFDVESLSDRDWVERAHRVVDRTLGVTGDPARNWVDRWPDTLAVMDAEQEGRVSAVERTLADRGILLAGGAFHGPGIDGAIRSGEATALALDALRRAS